jgi:hypothetical protein
MNVFHVMEIQKHALVLLVYKPQQQHVQPVMLKVVLQLVKHVVLSKKEMEQLHYLLQIKLNHVNHIVLLQNLLKLLVKQVIYLLQV